MVSLLFKFWTIPSPCQRIIRKRWRTISLKKYTARIKRETQLAPNGQCIIWTGCTAKGRGECLYGKIYVTFLRGGKYKWQAFRVHHLAYILHVRAEIPENMHCSHRCHDSLCVNVEHLTIEHAFVNSNRRSCSTARKCFGHCEAPSYLFFK